MDISGYTGFVSGVTLNISNQLAPRSISASTVGSTFIELANIVKSSFDSTYSKAEIDTKISLIPTGSTVQEISNDGKILRGASYTGSTYIPITGRTLVNGYYKVDLSFVADTNYWSATYPVTVGKTYKVTATVPIDTQAGATIWRRSNGALITVNNRGNGSTEQTITDADRTAPDLAATLTVVGKTPESIILKEPEILLQQPAYAGGSTKTLKQVEDLIPTGATVSEIDSNGKVLRGTSYLTGGYVDRTGTTQSTLGYYKYNTGVYMTGTSLYSKMFRVTPNSTITVSSTVNYNDSAMCVWFGSDGTTFRGFNYRGTNADFTYTRQTVTVPSNAYYVAVTGQYNYGKIEDPESKYREVITSPFNPIGLKTGWAGDSNTAQSDSTGWVQKYNAVMSPSNIHNVAIGGSRWSKSSYTGGTGNIILSQNFNDADFVGISDGTSGDGSDPIERQKRYNNCAVVHVQKFIAEVTGGTYPVPDIFFFAYGTNDDQFLGDSATALSGKTIDVNNTYTMANAMRWCLQAISTAFPKCKIFVNTPIQNASVSKNEALKQKIAIYRDIAGAFGAVIIDCYNESGIIEKFETSGTAGRYLRDGTHSNYDGAQLWGNYVANRVKVYYL